MLAPMIKDWNGDTPLATFDIETTGLGTKDQIVSWAVAIVHPNGEVEGVQEQLCMPTCEISAGATATHGWTLEKLAAARDVLPYERGMAGLAGALHGISGLPLAGYNILRFDWPFATREFKRLGIVQPEPELIIDVYRMARVALPHLDSRTLGSVAQFLDIEPDGELHSAATDATLTGRVAFAMYHYAARQDAGDEDDYWPNGPFMRE